MSFAFGNGVHECNNTLSCASYDGESWYFEWLFSFCFFALGCPFDCAQGDNFF